MDGSGRRRRTDQSPVLDGQGLGLDGSDHGSGRVWTRTGLTFSSGEERSPSGRMWLGSQLKRAQLE